MNDFKYLFILSAICLFTLSCKDNKEPEVISVATTAEMSSTNSLDPDATYAKAEFGIEGMTCAMGCAKSIEKKLAKMEGVKSAKVDFDNKLAMVEYDEDKLDPSSLRDAVASAGNDYKATEIKTVDSFSNSKICDKDCCKGKSLEEKSDCNRDCCKA